METLNSVSLSSLPIFDAFLDLPHPAASQNVNGKRMIVAPPPGEAFARSKDVGIELATESGIARVASFCFPEFNSDLKEDTNKGAEVIGPISPMLNKYDIYMQDYCSSNRVLGGPYHVFAMQLSSGQRVYGHVRRYYPHHPVAKGRYDVGRRGIRAMVLLTRVNGAESFYHSLLKTVESLSSHRYALDPDLQLSTSPQQNFLHRVHEEHSRLSKSFQSSNDKVHTFRSLTISIPQIEMGSSIFLHVDYSNFLLPLNLMSPYGSSESNNSPMLPLLRCLGISHTLRLFSALMCERRIVLVSQSTSRLSACAAAAMSILEQGLLHWQHIYIPILPPSMLNYLAAPMPYLVGLTANHAHNIEKIPGLGEVLVVYLDQNDIVTHNMSRPDLAIPDILNQPEFDDYQYQQQQQQPRFVSIAEVLKSDLINVMKMDRRSMTGDNGGAAIAVKEKGKDLLKRGLGKLKKVAKKKMDKNRGMNGSIHNAAPSQGMDPPGITDDDEEDSEPSSSYEFTEGFNNQVVEEDVKIAFTTFFLSFVGDMRWYLRPQSGGPPILDKDLFLEARERLGDSKNSPMYGLTAHFKETQIFEMFAKARVEDVQTKRQLSTNPSLFTKALNYLMSNRLPFSSPEIRNILRQISSSNPNSNFIQESVNVKRRAMALTSNSRPEQLVASELSKLAQDCRECVSVLGEVMSVIWERIRDCRGMQWKHGYYALQMLFELILHGPLAAVTEATDGIDMIRRLKSYEHMRNLVVQDMRSMAHSVYNILVNRARLFAMRRVCALRRMEAVNAHRHPRKANRNLSIRMKFNVMHALLKPGGAVSPAPVTDLLGTSIQSPIAVGMNAAGTSSSYPKVPTYQEDLLSLFHPTPSTSAPTITHPSDNHLDITEMVNNISIAPQVPPFAQVPTTTTPSFAVQPTIAVIPAGKQEQATMVPIPPNSQPINVPPDNYMFLDNQRQHPVVPQPHHFSSVDPMHQHISYNQNSSVQHQPRPNASTVQNHNTIRSQFDPLA